MSKSADGEPAAKKRALVMKPPTAVGSVGMAYIVGSDRGVDGLACLALFTPLVLHRIHEFTDTQWFVCLRSVCGYAYAHTRHLPEQILRLPSAAKSIQTCRQIRL